MNSILDTIKLITVSQVTQKYQQFRTTYYYLPWNCTDWNKFPSCTFSGSILQLW